MFHYLYVKGYPGGEAYELLIFLSENYVVILGALWAGAFTAAVFLARFMVKYSREQDKLRRAQLERERFAAAGQAPDGLGADGLIGETANIAAPAADGTAKPETGKEKVAFIEDDYEHYEPYKPRFRHDIFLYAALIINVSATVLSFVLALY